MSLVARIVIGVLCIFAIYVGAKAVKLHNSVEKYFQQNNMIDKHAEKLFNQAMYYSVATFCAIILSILVMVCL